MTTEPTDAELVERCLRAKDAFEELYRRHSPAVYAFLKSLHRDEHAAADSLQETFLRAYKALPRFDRARPLKPWLFTIANNVALDALDKNKRIKAQDPEILHDLVGASKEASPESKVTTGDTWTSIVNAAGGRLQPRKLAAFLLARSQGLSYQEIAEIHECSVATVKRDLQEALDALTGAAAQLGLV